jgi:ABC-2 type transport system permease protein
MSAALIARHEWRRLRVQPFAWLLAAAVVALMAWQFLLALQGFIDLAPQLGGQDGAPGVTRLVSVPLLRGFANLLVLLVPLLTMQAIAGERRAHTLPLLLASGTSALRIVLGKFAGAFGFVLVLCVPVAAMALSPALGTDLDGGHLAAALLGLALFAGALTAIGVLASAWAAQPALAAALALAITGLLAVVDAGARLQGVSNGAINYLALPTHLEPFFRGIVSSVDAGSFVLLAAVALALAARRLDALRGRAG